MSGTLKERGEEGQVRAETKGGLKKPGRKGKGSVELLVASSKRAKETNKKGGGGTLEERVKGPLRWEKKRRLMRGNPQL